jgi:methionyl-tRNA synthetase
MPPPRSDAAINDRQYGRAVRKVMELADQINRYFDEKQPWALAKDPRKRDELHRVGERLHRRIQEPLVFLAPILPARPRGGRPTFLGYGRRFAWVDLHVDPTRIGEVQAPDGPHRSEADRRPVRAPKASPSPSPGKSERGAAKAAAELLLQKARRRPSPSTTSRRSTSASRALVDAQHVDGSDKLLKLTLDIGEAQPRTVFAGIKSAYDPRSSWAA